MLACAPRAFGSRKPARLPFRRVPAERAGKSRACSAWPCAPARCHSRFRGFLRRARRFRVVFCRVACCHLRLRCVFALARAVFLRACQKLRLFGFCSNTPKGQFWPFRKKKSARRAGCGLICAAALWRGRKMMLLCMLCAFFAGENARHCARRFPRASRALAVARFCAALFQPTRESRAMPAARFISALPRALRTCRALALASLRAKAWHVRSLRYAVSAALSCAPSFGASLGSMAPNVLRCALCISARSPSASWSA